MLSFTGEGPLKGEDPATPGLLPKGIDTGTVTIPQYRSIIKQSNTHTHTEKGGGETSAIDQVIVTLNTASVSIMSPTRTHGTDKIEG